MTKPPKEEDLQWKSTSIGRRPPMKDDHKILKVKYLGNNFLDHTQTLDLSLNDQIIIDKSLKLRLPTTER
jgi:hypothetical protein